MTSETDRRAGKRAAHAMRTAALRLALERAGQEPDPALVYGCVDWFRYDASSQAQEEGAVVSSSASRRDGGRSDSSLRH